MQKKNRTNIIKTPKHNIPIGVPIKNEEGNYSLMFKMPGEQEYEELQLDKLLNMVVNATK